MEEKLKLNEAEVLNPADLVSKEVVEKTKLLTNPTDEEWNTLYEEYSKAKLPNYSVIRVTNLERKGSNQKETGYVKYNASETGTQNKHKFLFFGNKKLIQLNQEN